MSTQTKLALGAVFSTIAALAIVLALLFGWTDAPSPWDFLFGFLTGVLAGLGATLAVAGLLERRRGA